MRSWLLNIVLLYCLFGFSQNDSMDGARGSKAESTTSASSGIKRALVIGISDYIESELNLNYADKDAELFKEYLIKVDSIPEKNITLLTNEDATSYRISNALINLINITEEGDIVYLFFAGHGDVVDKDSVEEKIGFLLAHDVNKEREYYGTQGVVPFKDINTTVNSIANKNAKIVLVLDACKSGFLYLDGSQRNLQAMNNTFENSTKLLSCKPNQLSYESSEKTSAIGQGFFTYYLVLGLMGAADDLIPDFNLQSFELQSFLDRNVSAATANKQSPVVKTTKSTEILKKINSIDRSDALSQILESSGIKSLLANRSDGNNPDSTSLVNANIIRQFNSALKSKDYYGSEISAQELIYKAEKNDSIPRELIQNLKDNLINRLSIEAQDLINTYISNSEHIPPGAVFLEKAKYLDICLSYMDESEFMYNRILCSKLFLEAYSVIRMKQLDKYLEAKSKLEKAIRIENKAAYLYNALGIINNDLEYFEEAESNYLTAQKLIPTWSYPVINLGNNYLDINKYNLAIEYFLKASKLKFAKKTAYNNIGATYEKMGKYRNAENNYLISGEEDGKFLSITLRNLAKLYNKRGNKLKALGYFKQTFDQDSTNLLNLTDYSRFLVEENIDPQLAEKLLFKAIQMEPYRSEGYRELADYYRRFKYEKKYHLEADSLYRKAISLNPHDTWAYAGRGWNLKNLKSENVENQFLTGIRNNPQKASSYYHLANYYTDYERKELYYFKAIKQDSFYMNAYKKLVELYNRNKDYDKSIKLLNGVKLWNSESPIVYNLLGNTYFGQNDFDNAINYYKKSIEVDSSFAEGLANLSFCKLKTGDFNGAVDTYKLAVLNNPFSNKIENFSKLILSEARRLERNEKFVQLEELLLLNYKLIENNQNVYKVANFYYMNNQAKKAGDILKSANKLKDSRSWQIKFLTLRVKIALDLNEYSEAFKYFKELEKVLPREDKVLKAIVTFVNGNKEEALNIYKAANVLELSQPLLRKKYSLKGIELINKLKK